MRYRQIPGFPGYKVGKDGTVWTKKKKGRHLDKYETCWRKLSIKRHPRGDYFLVTICHQSKYKTWLLHRLVLEVFVGPPPHSKSLACHKDDDKTNNHLENLYWGDHRSNMDDAMRNGKTTKGETNGCAKLNETQVKEIIRLRAEEGIGSRRLAKMFGVVPQTIQLILSGTNWSHLERLETTITQGDTVRGDKNPSVVLTEKQVLQIVQMCKTRDLSQEKIGSIFGVHQTVVSSIMRGKTWSHVTGIVK